MTYKCFGIGKGLRHHTLGFFENLSNVFGIVGVGQIVGEQMERFLAATLSTARISFGEAVDTHATTASGLVQFVDTVSVVVVNVVLGDAVEKKLTM